MKVVLPFGIGTPESKRDSYRKALIAVGIEPVETVGSLESADGLLLAGGTDVDPALYGEERRPETDYPADGVRDRLELSLLREALDRDLPVLGICRGLQLFNVALGGSLIQHIDGHKCPKVRDVHSVKIAAGSRLESIYGTREIVVNSRHHQCAGRVAESLVVTATSPDDIVEALELPGHRFALAVQWHPEARLDGADLFLFKAFAAAATDR
jgi:gamma-glutamyl-gamma-aminobutyrate hydrolase PuuD